MHLLEVLERNTNAGEKSKRQYKQDKLRMFFLAHVDRLLRYARGSSRPIFNPELGGAGY